MNLSHTRRWFTAWRSLFLGSWHLRRSPDAQLEAAKALYFLNRYTESHLSGYKQTVYTLKQRLIRTLYRQGYSRRVTREVQTLTCHRCGGTGLYWSYSYGEDECWHCRGTGIYREIDLLRFEFIIDGVRFLWHQPEAVVEFEPFVYPDAQREYAGFKSVVCDGFDWSVAWRCFGVVNAYLDREGNEMRWPSLWVALRADLRPTYRLWRSDLRDWWGDVKWALRQAQYLPPAKYTEFPF